MLETQIEISASPATVRGVFLDFAKIPEWHKGYVEFIHPTTVTFGQSIMPGDTVECKIGGVEFKATIEACSLITSLSLTPTENSETVFRWQGPLVFGLIAGNHSFIFEVSKVMPGGTTFKQRETFSGAGAFLMSEWLPLGKKTMRNFEGFSKDLKRRAESLEKKSAIP